MFVSKYEKEFSQYYEFRSSILSDSARMHELCYLKRFDKYIADNIQTDENVLSESFMCRWISTLQGESISIANEVIVIRQFLKYLNLRGYNTFIPVVPKVQDDYSPYIFSDEELELIFASADNTIVKDKKACIYLPIVFPVILRLLFCCGLRIGETVRIKMKDADLENGVLRLVNTKGDKHRLVPMSEKMTDILSKYCLAMGLIGNGEAWLFPGNDKKDHISDRSIKRRLPSEKTRRAITYALNQKASLMRVLDDPRLELTNNAAERAIRPVTVGRKNWLFCDSEKGAHAAAVLYSILNTAKMNGLKVYDYLNWVFERIRRCDFDNIEELAPWSELIPENVRL